MSIHSFVRSAALLTAATAALLGLSAANADDIAMFRGNAAHTGVYQAPPITKVPAVKWRFHTKGYVISSPALAEGTIYVGSTDRYLYAIDATTGAQRWKFPTGARVASSPAVANGLVYVESYDGNFYAVDAASGKEKWRFATGGEHRFSAPHLHGMLPLKEVMPDPFDFYLSSPAIASGNVYFGSGDGNVYALDAASGALKWKFMTGNVVHSSPAVSDGTLYVGSWDHFLYALDAATGKLRWKFETGADNAIHNQEGIQSSPAVAGGVVYFGCRDSKFYAVDAKTGKESWHYDNKGSWVINTPGVRNGVVYWGTSDTGKFHASDAKTGVDRFGVDFNHWPMFSSPALVGDVAYIGSHNGSFYAIDIAKGAVLWHYETDAAKKTVPGLSNPDGTPNYYAVQSEPFCDGMVVAVERTMETGAILSSPAVGPDGSVYFGSMDGDVYALKSKG
jgi:outer membrane protein assembly factor BamB